VFDETNTYPDEDANLSIPALAVWFQNQMKWYSIDDLDNVLATGPNPSISLDCVMSDIIPNMCVGDHELVLKIAFGTFEQTDFVNASITEPNQPPNLVANPSFDTADIANSSGIPGNSTLINLMSQFFDQVTFTDPDVNSDGTEDPLSLSWSDSDGNPLSPLQTVTAGDYIYKLTATDPYGSTDIITLTLTMTELNEIPIVTIAAVNESEIGMDQNSIENQEVFLFGFAEDEDNDVDESTSTTDDDVNYLWICTQDGNPIALINETSINASFISPLVSTNSETEIVTCTLQATDPFQTIAETSSTSESINITIYNDNQPPAIDISAALKPSMEEGSSLEIILSELIANNFISVTDIDNDLNFTLEIDPDENYNVDNSTITPNSEFYGELSIPIRVDDGFVFGGELYNNLSETAYLIIDVIGINDPPILEGPANSATIEGIDDEIIGISVSDGDIDGIINDARLQFDLSAENGTISLSGDLGLIFADDCDCDGSNDVMLSFTASPSNFNIAVSTLIFHSSADYLGDGEISIVVNDEGNIGIPDGTDPTELTDLHIINITVNSINDPPELILPTLSPINEDTELIISGISILDEIISSVSSLIGLKVGRMSSGGSFMELTVIFIICKSVNSVGSVPSGIPIFPSSFTTILISPSPR
jgi:hypothetical protein